MRYLLVILLSFCAVIGNGQFKIGKVNAKKITSLPFRMLTGGTVIVKATLDDFGDTLNFVFDTGSGGISLDSTTARNLNLPLVKTERNIRGIAGMKNLDFVFNRALRFKNLLVDSLDFHINNYDILTSAYGVKIDGVIGLSFLKRFIVAINYDEYIMDIYSPGNFKYPKNGYTLHPNFNSLPSVSSIVSDNSVSNASFIFDTGAGLNMLLSDEYIKDSSILKKNRKLFVTQAEGLGGKKVMNITVLKKLALGPYKFRWVPVYIFKDDYNVTGYPKMGGVLGNDILRRFNLVINYPDKKIHIKPNTHFFDDFDYSYTGLALYQVDDKIIIEDVVASSPADKAGIKPNDIIFAVNNDFTQNLQAYKQALQTADNSIKMIIIRNGELLNISLEVQHLMH